MSETSTTQPDTATPAADAPDRGGWPAEDTADAVSAGAAAFADVPTDERGFPTEEVMFQALKAVLDPEIGINIVDLGLVYDVAVTDEGTAQVRMTLTTMGCPLTELLHQQCTLVLARLPKVEDVEVEFVFSPPWSTEMISDEAKDELRAMGFAV